MRSFIVSYPTRKKKKKRKKVNTRSFLSDFGGLKDARVPARHTSKRCLGGKKDLKVKWKSLKVVKRKGRSVSDVIVGPAELDVSCWRVYVLGSILHATFSHLGGECPGRWKSRGVFDHCTTPSRASTSLSCFLFYRISQMKTVIERGVSQILRKTKSSISTN